MKNFLLLCFCLIMLTVKLHAQKHKKSDWVYPSVEYIDNEISITYDYYYEEKLSIEQYQRAPMGKVVIYNKNHLHERTYYSYNDPENYNFKIYDYDSFTVKECIVTPDYKVAIESPFAKGLQSVSRVGGLKVNVLGFDCDKSKVLIKGKPMDIYSTDELGLRYTDNFNSYGFILEYPGYSEEYGYYKLIATKIINLNTSQNIFNLEGFKHYKNKEEFESYARIKDKRTVEAANLNYDFIDKAVPNFESEYLNGEKVSLEDLKGNVVLISFGFTRDDDFQKEVETIKSFSEIQDSNFKNITIFLNPLKDDVKDFAVKNQLNSVSMIANGLWIQDLFAIKHYPSHIIIDKKGVARFFSNNQIVDPKIYKDLIGLLLNEE